MQILTDAEAWTIANALRIAADQYEADALIHGRGLSSEDLMPSEARASLVRQFEDQAKLARAMAARFESATHIGIED